MKTLIIEDEPIAVHNLTTLLSDLRPEWDFSQTTDSISSSIEWFAAHPMPDLVFMDIHLADGSAFEIFNHVEITCPVIFTTAYDEYALRAFQVNSIDYLLKPIAHEDVERALQKFDRLWAAGKRVEPSDSLMQLVHQLSNRKAYKTHFLIPAQGDKLLPVPTDLILLFYIDNGQVKAVLADNHEYVLPQTLDEVAESVNPAHFFRISRQCLLSREAVRDINLWFNKRLAVNLRTEAAGGRVMVSKARVQDFKEWFSRRGDE